MSDSANLPVSNPKKIIIRKNGSYIVLGNIPLVRKTQVVSEYGEPLTWKKIEDVAIEGEEYHLCRCGQSCNKPFCDGTHRQVGFDGTETAQTAGVSESKFTFHGGTHLVVEKDPTLCMNSGFCGFRDIGLDTLVTKTSDPKLRSLVIAMVERCPSGSLTYKIEEGEQEIEPDLPKQIALTTEITSNGPIEGPLWASGGIEIVRSDGQPFEPRERVTLCNCGHSCNKPLCDGTHRAEVEGKGSGL